MNGLYPLSSVLFVVSLLFCLFSFPFFSILKHYGYIVLDILVLLKTLWIPFFMYFLPRCIVWDSWLFCEK